MWFRTGGVSQPLTPYTITAWYYEIFCRLELYNYFIIAVGLPLHSGRQSDLTQAKTSGYVEKLMEISSIHVSICCIFPIIIL